MNLIKTGGLVAGIILFVFALLTWPFIVVTLLIIFGAIIAYRYFVYVLEK